MPFSPEAVRRAQAGDAAARDQLLVAVERVVRAFFVRRLGERTEVDDLVQNTLVRVHQGLDVLKDPARLKAFSLKAALFELQDHFRGRYATRERLFDPEELPEGAETPPMGDALDAARVMATLNERSRRVLELRAYGYRYEEIAEMTGSTEAAVKMQVKRALDRLRGLAGALVWVVAMLVAPRA
ncbi:MAG TPA: sigma-70 family RNA polymerase sigma factor [Rhodothermales bacterium]|nr:sigma-70 family RNA polymerase sigma factor [Rhodothermales bacterium]